MSTDLATLTSLPTSPVSTDLVKRGSTVEWLQRLQLCGSNCKYCAAGTIKSGNYGVPGQNDEIQDLGDTIDVLPLAVRMKAIDTTEDPLLIVYDEQDPVFQDIKERSTQSDSGCMWGQSFLLFERNTATVYEFFCGSKSARREAGKFGPYLPVSEEQAEAFGVEAQAPQPLTLTSQLAKSGRYTWHVPVVGKCTVPFKNLPPIEEIVKEMNKFLNPKTDGAEIVEKEGRSR